MTKSSIQVKLVTILVLLILAVMLVFGTFLQSRIISFYHVNFSQTMEAAFDNELTTLINEASQGKESIDRLSDVLNLYSGRIGINSERNYYVLNRKNGEVLTGSDSTSYLEKSNNILSAMAGKTGNSVEKNLDYIDYAVPAGENYIIYIKDDKTEMNNILKTIFLIVAQALVIGVFISVIFGYFLAKTLTRPIDNLTKKAKRFATGHYDERITIKSQDELGKLGNSFNNMASMIKNSVDEISNEKIKMETILQYMADGIIAFNSNQHVIHINPAAIEMLDIKNYDEIVFDDFFKNLDVDICMAQMMFMNQSNIERSIDLYNRHYKAYFAPFKIAREKLNGVIVIIQDITEAQRLDNSRREFVANVSHELRTPLTIIKSYAETLLEYEKDPDNAKFLDAINRETDRMTRLVTDLLSLSSLDNNKYSAKFTVFSLDELIKDVVSKMSIEAKNNAQQLEYFTSTAIPDIYADRDRIEQVLVNIISNAMKYSSEGGEINVYAGCLYNEVYIKIQDNGIGIPEKDLPRLFERFYRVDKARSREKGGTGLGLAIAKNLIELHGGTIKIDSEYGKGTEVLIKLPIHKEDEEE